jgi:ABC-type siderophore export system fused ATPase/permease subunit
MAKKEPVKKSNEDLRKELDAGDIMFKSLAKLLQEGEVTIDIHLYKQFSELLKERKVTFEYSDNVFKLSPINNK